MKEIINIFSSRELAIITWIIIVFIVILVKKVLRNDFLDFLKALLVKNLMIPIFIFITYIIIITIFISKIPFWDKVYIKDVVFWSLTVGIIYYLNSGATESDEKYIKNIIKENFKITILFEFIYNTFTFNYFIELFLLPFLFVINLLEIITKRKENINQNYFYAHKFFEYILYTIGVVLFICTIIVIKNNYYKKDIVYELICFFIPLVYLILTIPLAYILQLVANYQTLIRRVLLFGNYNKKEKQYRVIKVIKTCGLSVKKILDFKYKYCKNGYLEITRDEFDNFIFNYNNEK